MRQSFLVPETLETERLRLRLPRAEDFPAYADMLADPEVNRFIGGAELTDRAEVYRALGWLIGHWHLRGYGPWLVEDRASGALVGRVGGFYPLEWPAMEIAWTLGRAWWGQGLAQEAARADQRRGARQRAVAATRPQARLPRGRASRDLGHRLHRLRAS